MSQAALDREDVQVAPEFVPNPVDKEADPVLFFERRRLLLDQFAQIRSKNRAMLALLAGIETEAPRASPVRPPRCPAKWAELLYGFGTPQSVSDDSNLIQHQRALAVVRKLLLGGIANLEDKAILAEHAPILGRLLDHFGFVFPRYFTPALHHLYRLTLFGPRRGRAWGGTSWLAVVGYRGSRLLHLDCTRLCGAPVDPHRRTPSGRRVLGDESKCPAPRCQELDGALYVVIPAERT
jgi:hypothetical protein